MSKYANAGELRTPVKFVRVDKTDDSAGYQVPTEINVFGTDENNEEIYLRVKWVNSHGTEVFSAAKLEIQQPAILTCRYSPLINDTLLVYKKGDPQPYEIVSCDDVEEKHRWLEIAVKRKSSAR